MDANIEVRFELLLELNDISSLNMIIFSYAFFPSVDSFVGFEKTICNSFRFMHTI